MHTVPSFSLEPAYSLIKLDIGVATGRQYTDLLPEECDPVARADAIFVHGAA